MTPEAASEPDAADLNMLVEHRAAVPATATVEMVQAEFARTNWNFLAVLDGEILLGVCARRELIQELGSRFGFALNARHPVREHLIAAPLRVTLGTPVTTVFKMAAARELDAALGELLTAVAAFCQGAPFADDICVVVAVLEEN